MSDDSKAKTDAKPGAAPNRLRPTVIATPAKRVKAIAAAPAAPRPQTSAPKVNRPTVLPGVARRRIAVRSADMKRLSPGVEPRTAARAVRLVDGFVVEDAREDHVVQWGQAAQQHGGALLEAPEVPQADVAGQARGYVGRIVQLLAAIDIDPSRKLTVARAELEKLVCLARATLAPLENLKAALDSHARRLEEARLEIEAAALAALFLSEYLTSSRPDLSRGFLLREISLTRTALEIRGGEFERDSQRQTPRALIITIQDAVLVDLPECLDALGHARRRLNPTEAGELQHRLRTLLRKLDA